MDLVVEEGAQVEPCLLVGLPAGTPPRVEIAKEVDDILQGILEAGLDQVQVGLHEVQVVTVAARAGQLLETVQRRADGVEVGHEACDLRRVFRQRIAELPEASSNVLCVVGGRAQGHGLRSGNVRPSAAQL